MKNLSFIAIAFLILITSSCTKEEKESNILSSKIPYRKMSASEKILFKNQLAQKLEVDSNYIKFDDNVRKLVSIRIEAHKAHKKSLSQKQIVESYTNMNYKDEATMARRAVFERLLLLHITVPELKTLDRSARKAVFELASKNRSIK
ncbi:hypothetical protein [Pedobacter sp. MC2016-24]|uniref:hypothetical protein n=1 Tax=Pedobacter sp. MC2016-24 TaxID=2780090 RepID=UPI00188231F8|nr:hypothetical protein [Pedobacter sp. MC2016-24]MBE9602023.1 hypothetical protein [Pedobacter sp. MC2016-24]